MTSSTTDASFDPTSDSTLRKFRESLGRVYGDKLDRAVLLKTTPSRLSSHHFHFEVAVFLTQPFDRLTELNRVADLATDVLYEEGKVVHALVFSAENYGECTPLMHDVRTGGIIF